MARTLPLTTARRKLGAFSFGSKHLDACSPEEAFSRGAWLITGSTTTDFNLNKEVESRQTAPEPKLDKSVPLH
jgi:hypothetical protein